MKRSSADWGVCHILGREDQWDAWNWSCDLRANERPKKTAPYAQTNIQADMATLWLNRPHWTSEKWKEGKPVKGQNGSKWHQLAPNGTKWLLMVPNGSNWKNLKFLQVAPNGLNRFKIPPNGSKWLQLAPNGFRSAPYGSPWLQIAQIGSTWLQIAPNHSKLLQIALKCSKLVQITPNCSKLPQMAWNGLKCLLKAPNDSIWP